MGVNFPLILVIATAGTGLVWLVDALVFHPRRLAALAISAADGAIEQAATEASEPEIARPVVVEYSISFFPVLLVVLVLRSFLAEPFQIPTGSMIPSLEVGDFILVNKYAYGIRLPVLGTRIIDMDEPKTGEVMVFIPPHENEYFIKRIVGVPGDRVRYENKTLYINDVEQTRSFVANIPPNRPRYQVYSEKLGVSEHLIHVSPYREDRPDEWVVPEGHYFMMGDNRDQSSDSRDWSFVSEEKIVGKAVAIWLHKEPGFNMPTLDRNGLIR
ncbi:MAG: signal peptidase I [Pseudomonadota bacterium]